MKIFTVANLIKFDFRYGKWREGICTRVMLWSPDKAIPNEIKYLQELLSENAPSNVLQEECNYIAKWINTEKEYNDRLCRINITIKRTR